MVKHLLTFFTVVRKTCKTSCFWMKNPKARVPCIMSEDRRCQNGKWNKEWNKDLASLPDHFLYRGVVRTVVHVLGSAGAENKKDK